MGAGSADMVAARAVTRRALFSKRKQMHQPLFTVDVEESFHASALESFIPRHEWAGLPTRVERGVDRLLELLDQYKATATFFTLGEVARRTPQVVQRIAAAGHEVASHGWSHRRVHDLTPREFRDELARSRDLLASLGGQPVLGFRAPNFSLVRSCEWAFDILLEEGYEYDSSVFPARRNGRGFPGGVHHIRRPAGELLEVPMTPATFGAVRVPAGGGAWFRLFPYRMSRRALRQAAARGQPGMFYIHPWEVDPEQPKFALDARTRLRHYGGLHQVVPRLQRLLSEFRFSSIEQWRRARQLAVAS